MDPKQLAADIRKAVRAATRTPGDVLAGLAVSVTCDGSGSMCTSIDVKVRGLDARWLYVPHPEIPGAHELTPYARGIQERLDALAAPAREWADDRMHFLDVGFADVQGALAEDTAAELARVLERCRRLTQELADARLALAQPARLCPNGHGPMAGQASVRDAHGEDMGVLHACTQPGCGGRVLVPTDYLLAVWAQATMADRADQQPQLGPRHGAAGLAAVR